MGCEQLDSFTYDMSNNSAEACDSADEVDSSKKNFVDMVQETLIKRIFSEIDEILSTNQSADKTK